MTRRLSVLAAFGIALAPLTQAMAAQGNAGISPDMEAKFQQDAEKSCNYDLDHDRFGTYGSMDECISDKSAKFEHDYRAKAAQTQSAGASH
jgi:hypothetical protein